MEENKNTEQTQNQQTEGTTESTPNYEELFTKMDEWLEKRQANVAKSQLKANGFEDEEAKDIYAQYKKAKETKKTKAETDYTTLKQQNAEMQKELLGLKMNGAAATVAAEIGMNPKRLSKAMKLADMTGVVNNGVVDNEKLKAALQSVLDDIPEFKLSEQKDENNGVKKVGASENGKQETDYNEKLKKAFGL